MFLGYPYTPTRYFPFKLLYNPFFTECSPFSLGETHSRFSTLLSLFIPFLWFTCVLFLGSIFITNVSATILWMSLLSLLFPIDCFKNTSLYPCLPLEDKRATGFRILLLIVENISPFLLTRYFSFVFLITCHFILLFLIWCLAWGLPPSISHQKPNQAGHESNVHSPPYKRPCPTIRRTAWFDFRCVLAERDATARGQILAISVSESQAHIGTVTLLVLGCQPIAVCRISPHECIQFSTNYEKSSMSEISSPTSCNLSLVCSTSFPCTADETSATTSRGNETMSPIKSNIPIRYFFNG